MSSYFKQALINEREYAQSKTVSDTGSSLLVINSKDRFSASNQSTVQPTQSFNQPWNNFFLSVPDRMLPSEGIKSLRLKSIRFPWSIPNITSYNNNIIFTFYNLTGDVYTVLQTTTVDIGFGFFTGAEIATDVNTQLTAANIPLTLTWFPGTGGNQFTLVFTANITTVLPTCNVMRITAKNILTNSIITKNQYTTTPSLPWTMGLSPFNYGDDITTLNTNDGIDFSPTTLLYTNYVDIVSTRLNQYRRIQDGASVSSAKKLLVTRLYCANETSTVEENLIGTVPFLIHRQVHEKKIIWNNEATIDNLDFSVYDEYGNLVWTQSALANQPAYYTPDFTNNSYPDFQMTFEVCN